MADTVVDSKSQSSSTNIIDSSLTAIKPVESKSSGELIVPKEYFGVDLNNIDDSVRPQDDFYTYVNGEWLKTIRIPEDKSAWGSFYELREKTLNQLYSIIDKLNNANPMMLNDDQLKLANIYKSYMNEELIESLGVSPIKEQLNKIDELKSKKQLPEILAYFSRLGVNTPYDISIHQDNKNSTKVITDIVQSGIGLPDRDYYLKNNDLKLKNIRKKYLQHIENMLTLIKDENAHINAAKVFALEVELAKIQLSKTENRDPIKTYNKLTLNELYKLTPNYDWNKYLVAADLKEKIDYVIVSQPSYIKGFNAIIKKVPLSTWKEYLKWHLISDFSPLLSKKYVEENFAFYGTILHGIPQNEPRWKRAIKLLEGSMGEALGHLYVDKYFPKENKISMEKLVANLVTAYRQSIESLEWMSPLTKKYAQKKLAAMALKIGYPNKWRNYSSLKIKKDDLIGNVISANSFEYKRNINKLGKPVDKAEWGMTPQTVNAYYNPELNEIVFPAAILQPPFFNIKADNAVNYGGIGAVIGHEISHAFDDQGSQYDEIGNLHNWWTESDRQRFEEKTKKLVNQYNQYSPLDGYKVNGELTLGENIADNSGLAIAYKAYQLSLQKESATIIDGTTGSQRFYLGWAQVWRSKVRDEQIIANIKADPHSPAKYRSNGTLSNQAGFYKAFDVKVGDKMYLSPSDRVTIW